MAQSLSLLIRFASTRNRCNFSVFNKIVSRIPWINAMTTRDFSVARNDKKTNVAQPVSAKTSGQYEPTSSTPLEVERRFVIENDTEERIIAAGASLIKDQRFTDSYFDTPELHLTSEDYWLRLRDSEWQLKYPPAVRMSSNSAEYIEVENERKIGEILAADFQNRFRAVDLTTTPLSSCRRLEILREFCTIVTRRRKFLIDGVVVDVDVADFGFSVGEMEVVVETAGDAVTVERRRGEALRAIDAVANKLGIKTESRNIHGKLTTYLKLYRPQHFELLVQKGVIHS